MSKAKTSYTKITDCIAENCIRILWTCLGRWRHRAAAGQITKRLKETDGEEKQFLVFQTEGAETDGMVPEVLRAVLNADGKRAHLVTPFLEQLLFSEDADVL